MNLNELKSLGWTLLALLFVRAFVAEPYKIPSGSMIPTLLIGDHILVAKSSYDLRIPFTDIQFAKVADPQRGDVVVFKYPNYEQDPGKDGIFFIKRLIGTPGDVIEVKKGVLTINGAVIERQTLDVGEFPEILPQYRRNPESVTLFSETLPGQKHAHVLQQYRSDLEHLSDAVTTWERISGKDCIQVGTAVKGREYMPDNRLMNQVCEFTVPADHYFFMGDNRDDSSDGRAWGFVPREFLKGKALFIWLPWKSRALENDWDYQAKLTEGEGGPLLRWKRFGLRIH
ncbi:MAG: signal peptidase I [Bdellovibrionota bacterium]